jgi:hypothetical protein
MSTAAQDDSHLKLLSVFYYVWGGLTVLLSCCGVVWILIAGGVLTAVAREQNGPPAWVGGFVMVIGLVAIAFAWVIAGLTIWTGYNLSQRKHYTFCLVVAAISCLSFPFGTALGVFTIIVLLRPTVKQLFGEMPATPA